MLSHLKITVISIPNRIYVWVEMYFGTRRPRQRSSGGDVEAQTGLIMNSCLKDSFHMKQLPATCFFHGELRLCLNKWWFFQVSLLNWQMVPGSIAWKKLNNGGTLPQQPSPLWSLPSSKPLSLSSQWSSAITVIIIIKPATCPPSLSAK